jgi:uncharacterized protein YqeY
MTIYETIKEKHKQAIKIRDAGFTRKFLSFVLGEIENKYSQFEDKEKTFPDKLVIKGLKSIRKNIEKAAEEKMEFELKIIDSLLPAQMSESEIKAVFDKNQHLQLGDKMKLLNTEYAGLFDGKLASDIAKTY